MADIQPPQHPLCKALVIMAHGSRRASANEEFFNLVRQIESQATDYTVCRPALLEQAPPTLLQACEALPEEVKQIDVYPLFFNCGRHVERDIPAQVAEVMDAMPEREIRLLDYLGCSEGLANLVLSHVAGQNKTGITP